MAALQEPFLENKEGVFPAYWARFQHFSTPHPSHSDVDEFMHLGYCGRTSLKALYCPEKPKYRMAPSDSTTTFDPVSSTDKVQSEMSSDWDFCDCRWLTWQGL
jgi:hypothetical protein